MSKLICSLLVCSMVFSFGLLTFAQDHSDLVDNLKSATLVRRAVNEEFVVHRHGGFKAAIDKLVEEGKLSREKAEQIDQYLKQRREAQRNKDKSEKQDIKRGFKHGMLSDLVKEKIITEAEAEAIRNKFKEMKDQALNEKLNVLVQKGTITQLQADKVKVYFKDARQAKEEQFKKLENMTEEQRKAFFKEYKKVGPMTKLVEDGVLTQQQVQELRKAMKEE